MNISIIVPTRKRPQNVINIAKSLNETLSNLLSVEVVFYVDSDDEETKTFFKEQSKKNTLNISANVVVGDRVKLGSCYNSAFKKCSGDIIMYAADDVYFRTKNWDYLVYEEFNRYKDKIALVFGYDGIQPKGTLATHGCISRKSIETLGYVHPGDIGYNYSDNWLTEIYRQLDRLIYIPVYFEHRHWGVGKATYDETYRLGSDAPHQESKDVWADKERLYKDIKKLKDILND